MAKHPDVERLSQTTDRLKSTNMYVYKYNTQYVHTYIYIYIDIVFVGFKKPIPKSISQHHPASWGLMFTSQFYGLDFRRIQNVDKDPSGYVNMCVCVCVS